MTRSITVGVGGSPTGPEAALWAADEAEVRGVPLRLVHVTEGKGAQESGTPLRTAADRVRALRPGLTVTSGRLPGPAADALAAVANDREDTELLVMGTGRPRTADGPGSAPVALDVLAAVRRPVVLVRPPERHGGTGPEAAPGRTGAGQPTVVIGVDGLRSCDDLFAFGFDEAVRRDAALRILHAWCPPRVHGGAAALDRDLVEGTDRELGDLLQPWRRKYPRVHVMDRALVGPATRQLVYASHDADLLVIGRDRRRPVRDRGSVTSRTRCCAAPPRRSPWCPMASLVPDGVPGGAPSASAPAGVRSVPPVAAHRAQTPDHEGVERDGHE